MSKLIIDFFELRIVAAQANGDEKFATVLGQLYIDLERYLERGKYIEDEK